MTPIGVGPIQCMAFREIILLRDIWTRGVARLRDLFTRNKVAPELRDEARQIVGDQPH